MVSNISRAGLVVLAQRLGIDRQIMAHRVVGSRVELYPLGGGCYLADLTVGDKPWLDGNNAWRPAQLPYLAELVVFLQETDDIGRKELYAIAQRLKLRGRSTMDAETLRDKALEKARRLQNGTWRATGYFVPKPFRSGRRESKEGKEWNLAPSPQPARPTPSHQGTQPTSTLPGASTWAPQVT